MVVGGVNFLNLTRLPGLQQLGLESFLYQYIHVNRDFLCDFEKKMLHSESSKISGVRVQKSEIELDRKDWNPAFLNVLTTRLDDS